MVSSTQRKPQKKKLAPATLRLTIQYYQPLMQQHEYILENYLVNYVFKNLFPVNGEKHIFDNYVLLIVHYAMIKMLLIGMAGFHKENFGIDQVIKLIQSFAKVIEHNNVYVKQAFQLLKGEQYEHSGLYGHPNQELAAVMITLYSNPDHEVIYRILELLPTIEEALQHMTHAN